MKHIVIEAHKSNYPDPLTFKKGDSLIVGKKDTEYKNWIWVTTKNGKSGWCPVQYLELIESSNEAVANCDYTAKELDTEINDIVIIHHELNEWGWVEKEDNSCGWVPMKTLKEIE